MRIQFKSILIVCTGNICRSPVAEYLLRHQLDGSGPRIESAGLNAMAGHPMDPTALELLAQQGIDSESHRGRQLTTGLLRHADLILGMEYGHVAAIKRMAPEVSGKTVLFTRWSGGKDIPDPYRQHRIAFEHTHGLIERNAESWLHYL